MLKEDEIKSLQHTIHILRTHKKDLTNKIMRIKKEHSNEQILVYQELQKMENIISEITEEKEQFQKENSELMDRIRAVQKTNKVLDEENLSLKIQIRKISEQIEKYRDQSKEIENLKKIQKEYEKLKLKFDQSEFVKEGLYQEIRQLELKSIQEIAAKQYKSNLFNKENDNCINSLIQGEKKNKTKKSSKRKFRVKLEQSGCSAEKHQTFKNGKISEEELQPLDISNYQTPKNSLNQKNSIFQNSCFMEDMESVILSVEKEEDKKSFESIQCYSFSNIPSIPEMPSSSNFFMRTIQFFENLFQIISLNQKCNQIPNSFLGLLISSNFKSDGISPLLINGYNDNLLSFLALTFKYEQVPSNYYTNLSFNRFTLATNDSNLVTAFSIETVSSLPINPTQSVNKLLLIVKLRKINKANIFTDFIIINLTISLKNYLLLFRKQDNDVTTPAKDRAQTGVFVNKFFIYIYLVQFNLIFSSVCRIKSVIVPISKVFRAILINLA